ncbi:MAG: hypothetical protein IPK19_19590 [Chloroflexi bacterium]|nr:hypothetical protein [Chloroflexota bacterium]
MKWIRRIPAFLLMLVLVFSIGFTLVQAQQRGDVCPGAVNEAMAALSPNCSGLGRNIACYGFNSVEASFNVDVSPETFTQTDDRIDLLTVNAIRTGELDLEDDTWGLSLLNLQANLPDALPGQGVIFVLLGGVEVEGGVDPELTTIPDETYPFTTTAATTLLNVPEEGGWYETETLASIPAGTALLVDAISREGGWVRTAYGALPGWVPLSAVQGDITPLPVVTKYTYTPMQTFYFRVGIGGVTCDEVPSVLLVQGPRDVEVNLRANGVSMRVTSTAILRTLPPGEPVGTTMEIIAISGAVIAFPDMPNQIVVPPGFAAVFPLCGQLMSLGIEGDVDERGICGEGYLRQLSPQELEDFALLENLPPTILHYPIEIPFITEESARTETNSFILFEDQENGNGVRDLCATGRLPEEICRQYGFTAAVPTPTATPPAAYQEPLLHQE